jgi:RHS repeat-associated protein
MWNPTTGNCESLQDLDTSEYDNAPNCEAVGDPCNPTTGGLIETFVDYEAPGFTFSRTWRSKAAPPTAYAGYITYALGGTTQWQAALPWGWTHSFAMRVLFEGDRLVALFRPDGAFVGVSETAPGSGIYVATDASDLQARGSHTSDVTVYRPDGGKEIYRYLSCGSTPGHRLEEVIDSRGRSTRVEYASACGVLQPPNRIVGPFGHTLNIEYNTSLWSARPFIKQLTDAAGQTIQFSYVTKTAGSYKDPVLDRVTYQDGTFVHYVYGDSRVANRRFLTGAVDESNVTYASFAYDAAGHVTSTESPGGYRRWTFVYNPDATTTATDANNVSVVYGVQSGIGRKNVIGDVTRAGTVRSKINEATGQYRLLTRINERGVQTSYQYDAYHLTSKTAAVGAIDVTPRTTTYAYLNDTSQLLTDEQTPSACDDGTQRYKTIHTDYLPGTQLISAHAESGGALNSSGGCDPISRVTGIQYGAPGSFTMDNGLPTVIQGPRASVADDTAITYYECTTGSECGQIASVTNAAGHTWTFDAYDAHGHVTQITQPNGATLNLVYDLRGRLRSSQESGGGQVRTTTYDYYPNGLVHRITKANGAYLNYTYNGARLLTEVADNYGNTIRYGYDLAENRTSEDIEDASQTLKKTVDYAYDAFNHLDSITEPGSFTDLQFDALGNLAHETDPNSHGTDYTYDSLNRLVETLDALSHVTGTEHDVNDALTSVAAPNGATTSYIYDDLGNLFSEQSPDRGTTTYEYDEAGNVVGKTDANGVAVAYGYDALNRLTSITYPDSSLNVAFLYDEGTNQKGRLTTMTDGSGTTTYGYDVFGNLTTETKDIDGNVYVTGYTYDVADLLETVTYPSGRTVTYTRNALGQIMAVDTTYDTTTVAAAQNVAYEPFGPLSGLTFGNGLVMSRTFDQQYRLTNQTTGSIQNLTFTPDAAGNVDAIADAVTPSLSQSFTQDALDRIDYESGAYGTEDYTYDEVGNRLTRVRDDGAITTQTLTYGPNSNRPATHDGNAVTIDAAGNVTADPAEDLTFTYGDHNRMLAAYVGGTLKATYVYNGHGQRVKKVEATGAQRTVIFHYGADDELIAETVYDSSGAKIEERDYVWLDTLPVAQSERTFAGSTITSDTLLYLHADQLDTPRVATNGSGTVVWRWDSDAFGVGNAQLDPDGDTNLVDVRLRFPGQYYDEEVALAYNYFRNYDPGLGRYVQADPVGLAGGLNPYLYANGNTLSSIDPLGLDVKVVTSDPAAAKILMEAYARVTSTKAGMLMCGALEKSPELYQIKPITKDAFYCPAGTTDPACRGDERTVFIDPYNNIFLPTTAGMQETPKAVVLAHELGHARGVRDDGPGAMNNVNAHENPVRRALGLPERTAYYLASPPVWVPGTK